MSELNYLAHHPNSPDSFNPIDHPGVNLMIQEKLQQNTKALVVQRIYVIQKVDVCSTDRCSYG